MDDNKINVGGRFHSIATGNVLAGANEILDDSKNKKQSDINAETDAALEDRYTKEQTYSKPELNNLITTPNQQYVSVTANSQTTTVTDVLPATGAANTVYRVGNWDGSQFDASVYSEYAWNGNQYVHLSTKTKIGEVFDISAYHATGGTLATYADLSAALDFNNGGGVPQSLQKGGMSIKFVQSSDDKYRHFSLTADSFTTDVRLWKEDYSPYLEKQTFNLYDTPLVNKYINASGDLVDRDNCRVSGLIKVNAGDVFSYQLSTINNAYCIAFCSNPDYSFDLTKSIQKTESGYIKGIYTVAVDGYLVVSYNTGSDALYFDYLGKDKNLPFFDNSCAIIKEKDSTDLSVHITVIHLDGKNVTAISNLAALKTALGKDSYDTAPSGADSIKIARYGYLCYNIETARYYITESPKYYDIIVVGNKTGEITAGLPYFEYNNLSAAIQQEATARQEAINTAIAEENLNKKIFDLRSTPLENKFINSSGAIQASDWCKLSKLIKVSKGDIFHYKLRHTSMSYMVAFYTSNDFSTIDLTKSLQQSQSGVKIVSGDYIVVADGYVAISYYWRNYEEIDSLYFEYKGLHNDEVDTQNIKDSAVTPQKLSFDVQDVITDESITPIKQNSTVASYMAEDYERAKNKVFNLTKWNNDNTKSCNVLLMTDLHYDSNPNDDKYLAVKRTFDTMSMFSKEVPCNLSALLGDYSINITPDTKEGGVRIMELANLWLSSIDSPKVALSGNHEKQWGGSSNYGLTMNEFVATILSKYINRDGITLDYVNDVSDQYNDIAIAHFDDSLCKIRHLLLSIFTNDALKNNKTTIASIAANTPAGYDLVVYNHFGIRVTGTATYANPEVFLYVQQTISEILSNLTNSSQLIAWVSGHTHTENVLVYNDVPVIGLLRSSFDYPEGVSQDGITYNNKVMKTVTEQTFTIMTVRKDLGKLYLTRVGCGADIEVNYNATGGQTIGRVWNGLSGVVYASDGSTPIYGATVSVIFLGVTYTTTTDSSGNYAFTKLPNEAGVLSVSKESYEFEDIALTISGNITQNVVAES